MGEVATGLDGRVVAVVGCGPGIGQASAQALGRAGATIACLDLQREVGLSVERELTAQGVTASATQVDVTDCASVHAALDAAVATYGRLDAVVDVVGGSRVIATADVDAAAWAQLLDLNLRQQFFVAQKSAELMKRSERGGSYVAIASTLGLGSAPRQAPYGAAKAGLASLMRSFACEYARDGIRFNAIAPGGLILTPRMARVGAGQGDLRRRFADAIPMGRIGLPEEIAGAVIFLASDLSLYLTGQTLVVDGGETITYTLPLIPPPAPQPA